MGLGTLLTISKLQFCHLKVWKREETTVHLYQSRILWDPLGLLPRSPCLVTLPLSLSLSLQFPRKDHLSQGYLVGEGVCSVPAVRMSGIARMPWEARRALCFVDTDGT